jgi:conjugative transfer signal peptidase TraF
MVAYDRAPGIKAESMAPNQPDQGTLKQLAAALLGILALALLARDYGKRYWLNTTDSEPVGLYRLERCPVQIGRGDLVLMEVPEPFHRYVYGRRWLPKGWPLVKHVGALAGDTFCVGAISFSVNGKEVGPVYQKDQTGLPLPRLQGCRSIPAGHFLPVASGTPRSFDGRYMGPVEITRILGRLTPIFTH